MPVPPPKNPGCPNFGVGMPHAWSGGDALSGLLFLNRVVCLTGMWFGEDQRANVVKEERGWTLSSSFNKLFHTR